MGIQSQQVVVSSNQLHQRVSFNHNSISQRQLEMVVSNFKNN